MNHLAHFGFSDDPFRLTPDRDFFFPSANHTALGEVIRFGLNQGEGFIIVSGEVGTGKTMVLRLLFSELTDQFETALVLSPHLSPTELLQAILRDIGIEEPPNIQISLDYLLRLLNEHLFHLSQTDKRLIIIIDEAQNLPEESIEQLRLLSNFETDKQKLLQIILIGQPELREKIEKPSLRQLVQRVTIMETLNPLTRKEMIQYIHFRLTKAGRNDIKLNRRACRMLWRYSQGVPRLINKIMSRALLVAFADKKQSLDYPVIRQATASLEMTPFHSSFLTSKLNWLVSMGLFLILLGWPSL